jgi:hypothetical protein
MTADQVPVPRPKHPMYALTTFELTGYRRELEHALSTLPGHAVAREQLRQRLAEVLSEQQSRTRLRNPDRPFTS